MKKRSETDWERLSRLTDEEIEAAAAADPDNPPLADEELARLEIAVPAGDKVKPDASGARQLAGARIRALRKQLPDDWKFDRDEANARTRSKP